MKMNFKPTTPGNIRPKVPSTLLAIAGIALVLCAASPAKAVTVAWGNSPLDTVMDSYGNELSEPPFLFQLGVFDGIFVPTLDNVSEWAANWRVFDESGYENMVGDPPEPVLDVFYSEARFVEYIDPLDNPEGYVVGGSTSDAANADNTYNFAQKQAYIWIRNSDNPVPGTEWFLATAPSWVFPTPSLQCCDTAIVNWEVQDIANSATLPVFGAASQYVGGGYSSNPTSPANTIQTYTFIPEPSSALFSAVSALVLLRRRRRDA
jgi:hypothetical protein